MEYFYNYYNSHKYNKLYYANRRFRYPQIAKYLRDVVTLMQKEYGYCYINLEKVTTFSCLLSQYKDKNMHVYLYDIPTYKAIAINFHKNGYFHGDIVEYRKHELYRIAHWNNGQWKYDKYLKDRNNINDLPIIYK